MQDDLERAIATAMPAPCGIHCTVCEGMDHHWMPDCDEDTGEPVMVCKHCDATTEYFDEDERDDDQNDYVKYRGKCKEMSESAVAADPSLTLVRGHYHCPIWGEQAHWWTKRPDGSIFDPSKDQFPSRGIGEYIEFDGMVQCSNCGKEMKEEEADYESNYCFCSYECHGKFVGVF